MTRVFLIRHGHTGNPKHVFYGPEFHLDNQGREQIHALAKEFITKNVHPIVIIASPFLRTFETASILAEAFPKAMLQNDQRLEEWRVGSWLDKPIDDFYVATKYFDHMPVPTLFPPEIEPLRVMADRVVKVIREQRKKHEGETLFLVSHREPLVSAMLHLQEKTFDTIHDVECPPGTAWELVFDGEKLISIQKWSS